MLAFTRIEMLVQSGTIETPQSPRVFRKVRGNPIHDHAYTGAMQIVDQVPKIVRLAVTR